MMRTRRIVGILLLLAVPALGDDWSHLGGDNGRTRVPFEIIVSPAPAAPYPTLATGAEAVASPVAADGFLVLAGVDGAVHAYREFDRTPLWTTMLGGPVLSTPLVDRGRVYVPCSDGTLSVLRLADGATLWSIRTEGADQSSPVIEGDFLFLGSGFPSSAAIAINVVTRTRAWSRSLEQVTNSSPAVVGGHVYLGCNSGRFYGLNAATGDPQGDFLTAAAAGASSPLVDGTSVYLLSGAQLTSMNPDPANWATSNWSVPLIDPAPPGGNVLGVDVATSSLAKAGGMLVCVVRFAYAFDQDGDTYVDTRVLREFAFAVDPLSPSIPPGWSVLLAQQNLSATDDLPPYKLCPTPVSTGAGVAVASSLDPTLRVLSTVDGTPLVPAFALDAPCLSSPMVANARLYALTRAGTLYTFEGTNAPPGAAAPLVPNGPEFDVAPATLSWNAAEPGATYVVRIATDGEVLMDWTSETVVSGTSLAMPALLDGFVYTWAVRARDVDGAFGPWSQASFGLNVPPLPPSGLTALAKHQKVLLSWAASPSSNVAEVQLRYGPTGGSFGAPVSLGLATAATVTGLTNGVTYTFEIRALDTDGDLSAPATAMATPVSLITIGGAGFDTLQAAAAAARPGETIQLGEDTFLLTGPVMLNSSVHLRGVNALATRVLGQGSYELLIARGGNTVSLLSLAGGSVGVHALGHGVRVANAVIRDMSDAGVLVTGSAEIVNNTIVRNASAGVRSTGPARARNNIVQENGTGFVGSIVSSYNDVSDGYAGAAAGPGDRSLPVTFLDPATGDYREAAGQPSLDAGDPRDDFSLEPSPNGGRVNLGAFGNTPLAATSAASSSPSVPAASGGKRCTASMPAGPAAPWLGAAILALVLVRRRRRG
jgi:outer membrane protein assembly factor BamB